jgi:ankyrin repeat protein
MYVADLDNMQFRMFHLGLSGISYPLLNIPDDWEDPEMITFLTRKRSMSRVDRLKSALQTGEWYANAATLEGVTGLICVSRARYNAANFAILTRTAGVLLEAGADVEACNTGGTTPLIFNIASDRTEAAEIHYSLVMANKLLQNGASVGVLHLLHATDECYLRPLLHANPGVLLHRVIDEPRVTKKEGNFIVRASVPRRRSTLSQLTSVVLESSDEITPLKESLTVLLFASGALL